jgi:hypothetical protein
VLWIYSLVVRTKYIAEVFKHITRFYEKQFDRRFDRLWIYSRGKCYLVPVLDDVEEALFTLDRVRVGARDLANLLCSSSVC